MNATLNADKPNADKPNDDKPTDDDGGGMANLNFFLFMI